MVDGGVCSDEGVFVGDGTGEAVLAVGRENGTEEGFAVGIGGSVLTKRDGIVVGAAMPGEGVGKATKIGACVGFVDGDSTVEDGTEDSLVGSEDGPSSDGMLLGDGVGSKSQTSIRQLRPTSVLRASKISQNSSTKIASSLPVKSIDMDGVSPGLAEHFLNAIGPMTFAQFDVMLLYPGTKQDSGDP